MKAAALGELKARLLLKYGAEAESTVTAQMATFFQHRPSISLQDLTAFDNLLAAQLGFPAKRRTQWSRLHHSSARESPSPAEVSQSTVLSRSVDLQPVPRPTEIVPITRHRKAAARTRDSPIFPRYENKTAYTPVPSQVKITDTLRTSFYWKGDEKLPVSVPPVDEWGQITKWDITKYHWEQQEGRRVIADKKQEYREYLGKQIQQKEEQTAAEKLQQAKEKQEVVQEAERLRALESRQAKARRKLSEEHQRVLQQEILQKAQQRHVLLQDKATERLRLNHKLSGEEEAEVQRLKARRAHCLSLTDHNLTAAAERQAAQRQVAHESKERDKHRAAALLHQSTTEDQQRRELERAAAREVQQHNRQEPRRGSTAESHHTAHAELFRLQEQRLRQTKHQLVQVVAELSQQALDKTKRDGVWKEQAQEQAALWRQEQARQLQQDLAQTAALRTQQQLVKHTLTQQVQIKQQAKAQARRLSPNEAQLNRPLFRAAIGAI